MERVRLVLAYHQAVGTRAPGRILLGRQTGATVHQIRQVQAELKIRESPLDTAGDDEPTETSPDTEPEAFAEPDTEPTHARFAPAGVNAGEPATSHTPAPTQPAPKPARKHAAPGKVVSTIGFAFGSVVSVAANVLAAWIAPEHAPPGWHPSIWAQVGAAVWPIALLLSVEVLSRGTRPSWWLAKVGIFLGVGGVTAGSFVISYGHIRDVLMSWAYSPLGAGVGPIVIDGLMMVCGFAMTAKPGEPVELPVASDHPDAPPAPAEPAPLPSFTALSVANGVTISPTLPDWRLVGDRLAKSGEDR